MLGLRDAPSVLSLTVTVPAAEALKGLPCRFVRRDTTYACRVNATCTLCFPRDAESAAPEPASCPSCLRCTRADTRASDYVLWWPNCMRKLPNERLDKGCRQGLCQFHCNIVTVCNINCSIATCVLNVCKHICTSRITCMQICTANWQGLNTKSTYRYSTQCFHSKR